MKKIALITGGTSGIGMSMVEALVERGFFVHFVGRNKARGEAIAAELNRVERRAAFIPLDLASLKDTASFAARFESEVGHLDVLANVAGVMMPARRETGEGLEMTMAIGHLSAYVLTRKLVPALARADHGRVVNVAGVAKKVLSQRLDFDDMDYKKTYKGTSVVIDAVHAKAVMSELLAVELKGQNIDVNAFHPGLVRSDLGKELSWVARGAFKVVSSFLPKVSETGIYVSASDEVTGMTGQFFVKRTASPLAFDDAYKAQLQKWTVAAVEGVLGVGWEG